jgi:hypothetical protein
MARRAPPEKNLQGIRMLLAALPAPIESLFLRFPELCGFSVRGCGDDGGLFVDHIGVSPGFQAEHYEEIFREIVVALAELVCEEPTAGEILRGRTFARVLH